MCVQPEALQRGSLWGVRCGKQMQAQRPLTSTKRIQSEPRGGSAFSQPATGLIYPSRHTCHGIQYGRREQTPLKPEHCSRGAGGVLSRPRCWFRIKKTMYTLLTYSYLDKVTPVMFKMTVQAGKEKIFCVTPLSFSTMQCIGWDRHKLHCRKQTEIFVLPINL